MKGPAYWLSRISPFREAFAYKDWAAFGGLDPYGQHRLLWRFFDIPSRQPDQPVPFLFRAEIRDGLPLFYVLSGQIPRDAAGKWLIEPQEYRPVLLPGDRLVFKLRANPVVERAGDPVLDNQGKPKIRQSGTRAGEEKRKVVRHDVVMEAKRRVGWKAMPPEERSTLAQIAYEAGSCWLRRREERLGCRFDAEGLRVDGHAVYCLKGRRNGERCRGIRLSTLDFEGVLTVVNPEPMTEALFKGIGPAKGFGCGLMLVRRASL